MISRLFKRKDRLAEAILNRLEGDKILKMIILINISRR